MKVDLFLVIEMIATPPKVEKKMTTALQGLLDGGQIQSKFYPNARVL